MTLFPHQAPTPTQPFVKVLTGVKSSNATSSKAVAKNEQETAEHGTCTSRQVGRCKAHEASSCCCRAHMFFTCSRYECCKEGYSCAGADGCQRDPPGPGPTPPSPRPPSPRPPSPPAPPASHRVLGSTSSSKVFINFVDHGAVGLIGFPRATMHATELAAALKTMHDKKMYKELVFYLEACESGSMFPEGSLQPGMYATTAANAKESSWGTYCGSDAKVDGKSIGSCLGDLYSVNWMEDSDKGVDGETIEQQFLKVQKLTTKSHVTEFKTDPDTVSSQPIDHFQGNKDALASAPASNDENDADAELKRRSTVALSRLRPHSCVLFSLPLALHPLPYPLTLTLVSLAQVDSRDAELESAYSRFMSTGSATAAHELIAGVQDRLSVEESSPKLEPKLPLEETWPKPSPYPSCSPLTPSALEPQARFAAISHTLGVDHKALLGAPTPSSIDWECHLQLHQTYVSSCGEWTSAGLKHSATLAKLCAKTDVTTIQTAIDAACAK